MQSYRQCPTTSGHSGCQLKPQKHCRHRYYAHHLYYYCRFYRGSHREIPDTRQGARRFCHHDTDRNWRGVAGGMDWTSFGLVRTRAVRGIFCIDNRGNSFAAGLSPHQKSYGLRHRYRPTSLDSNLCRWLGARAHHEKAREPSTYATYFETVPCHPDCHHTGLWRACLFGTRPDHE